jgi:hypothetical protein
MQISLQSRASGVADSSSAWNVERPQHRALRPAPPECVCQCEHPTRRGRPGLRFRRLRPCWSADLGYPLRAASLQRLWWLRCRFPEAPIGRLRTRLPRSKTPTVPRRRLTAADCAAYPCARFTSSFGIMLSASCSCTRLGVPLATAARLTHGDSDLCARKGEWQSTESKRFDSLRARPAGVEPSQAHERPSQDGTQQAETLQPTIRPDPACHPAHTASRPAGINGTSSVRRMFHG